MGGAANVGSNNIKRASETYLLISYHIVTAVKAVHELDSVLFRQKQVKNGKDENRVGERYQRANVSR